MIPPTKKGIEISVTYLVIIIVTILLFALSLYFLGIIGQGIQTISGELDQRTADQIEHLVRSENAIVALPFSVKETDLGDFAVFGIGIRNIGDTTDFAVKVTFQGAYLPDGRELLTADPAHIMQEWIGTSATSEPISIARETYEPYAITLRADSRISTQHDTVPADYAFNVCVYQPSRGEPSCTIDSISTESSILYPPGKIYTATVRVR